MSIVQLAYFASDGPQIASVQSTSNFSGKPNLHNERFTNSKPALSSPEQEDLAQPREREGGKVRDEDLG